METWIIVLIVAELAFIGWILWIVTNYRLGKSRERSEERLRLLERFNTSQEMTDFLSSEGGDKLLKAFEIPASDPRGKIIGGFTTGMITLFVGFGCLLLAALETFGEEDIFLPPGVILSFAGAAILISVVVSLRLLKANGSARTDRP